MTNNLYGYQVLLDDTEMQHKLCRDWLLEKMGESPRKHRRRATCALKQSNVSRYLRARSSAHGLQ